MDVKSYLWEAQCVACGHGKEDHIEIDYDNDIREQVWSCEKCECRFHYKLGSLEITKATTKYMTGMSILLRDAPNTCGNCGHTWEQHDGAVVNWTRHCGVAGCTCVLEIRDYPQVMWDQKPKMDYRDWATDDPVNHPSHYTSHPSGIECIQITEHMNFCIGNAVKYIWRAGLKRGAVQDRELAIQDLEKARWYLDREIKRLQSTSDRKS